MGGGCKDEKYWNMLNIFYLKYNQNQLVHYMLLTMAINVQKL
jgi:hypothetical protein